MENSILFLTPSLTCFMLNNLEASRPPSNAEESSASETEIPLPSATVGPRGVAGASSNVRAGRGRGRGRGQTKKEPEVKVGSSSGSDVSVSPAGSVSGEVADVAAVQERLESVELHDPVVPVPVVSFNPDTDFPMSRMAAQAELVESQPPQTRLNGKFPGIETILILEGLHWQK